MTQTPGDLWSRLRRPLLEPETRFAWAEAVFRELRLKIGEREQPLEELFARILFNDAERQSLAVGFSEAPPSRAGCDLVLKLERLAEGVRLEIALSGRLPKELRLGERLLASYPGAAEAPPGTVQGPFPSVAVLHV